LLNQKINQLETKFSQWESIQQTRPKRAYTEGGTPNSDPNCRLLYEKLRQHKKQKKKLVQSITQLKQYISQKSPHERDFDFNLDKCLDNASRKLKKNQTLLKKTKAQIVALKEQLPLDIVFPLHRPPVPSTISSSPHTKKKWSSKKLTRLSNLKKRSKTWPFS